MGTAARQVVVFDLDDTLYLERNYARSGFAAVGDWVRRELGVEHFFDAAWARFEAGDRERVFDQVLNDAGQPAHAELIARMIAVYREHQPCIELETDSKRWLAANAGRCGLALITDGFKTAQNAKIDALGLRDMDFEPIVVTDEWGREYWKPNARAYLAVEAHFAGSPNRFTYVADNPTKDFLAPRALGWHTVQIARPGGVHAADAPSAEHAAACRIASLDELDDALALETSP